MKNNSTFLSHKKEICLRAKSKIKRTYDEINVIEFLTQKTE